MAVKNILKYLRRTKDMFLVYGGVTEELVVRCHTDASFNTDRDDSRSQSGYVFTLNGGDIAWKSSKQEVVALSTIESEYIVASEAAQEVDWMKKFIRDLEVVPSIKNAIEMLCDNTGAISIAKDPMVTNKTRHIQRKYNFIRQELELGNVFIGKVHTDENLADPFTDPLSQNKFEGHAKGIGLRIASDWI